MKNEDEPLGSLAVRALGCNRIVCFVSLTFMVTGRPFATPGCCRRVVEGENNNLVTAWSGHTTGVLYESTGPSFNSPNSMRKQKVEEGPFFWGESCQKKTFWEEKFGLMTNNHLIPTSNEGISQFCTGTLHIYVSQNSRLIVKEC